MGTRKKIRNEWGERIEKRKKFQHQVGEWWAMVGWREKEFAVKVMGL